MFKRVMYAAAIALGIAAVSVSAEWVYEGQWGSAGAADGQFDNAVSIAVAPNGNVYVGEGAATSRVQYFTPTGSFLGTWGKSGGMKGEFLGPLDLAFTAAGDRVYVVEELNCRVQYFRWSDPAVVPTSLGKIKTLFQ
jgi:DNA-binding beta-propeller fold protein YncE